MGDKYFDRKGSQSLALVSASPAASGEHKGLSRVEQILAQKGAHIITYFHIKRKQNQ